MAIEDLANHPTAYLTIAELAEYWRVSPSQIRKRVQSGELAALRLGPHVYRISTGAAQAFELRARVGDGPTPAPRVKRDERVRVVAFAVGRSSDGPT
jgi:excisionase family DNA binding protein